jgi:hypothetical protein
MLDSLHLYRKVLPRPGRQMCELLRPQEARSFCAASRVADWVPFCSDYINPIDLCNRLNTYIIPEAAVHGFLTFLFLINGYWLPLLFNLPLLGWNIKKYVIPASSWEVMS